MTETMSQTEATRAYGHDIADGVYIVVATWTDENGEMTDMLVGTGDTAESAHAAAQAVVDGGDISPDAELTTYAIEAGDDE